MQAKINDIRDRLIVALDVPTIWDAYRIVSALGDQGTFTKIGYRLAFAGELDLARQLVSENEGLSRSQAARYRQHRHRGRRIADQAWRHLPHRPPIRRPCAAARSRAAAMPP